MKARVEGWEVVVFGLALALVAGAASWTAPSREPTVTDAGIVPAPRLPPGCAVVLETEILCIDLPDLELEPSPVPADSIREWPLEDHLEGIARSGEIR